MTDKEKKMAKAIMMHSVTVLIGFMMWMIPLTSLAAWALIISARLVNNRLPLLIALLLVAGSIITSLYLLKVFRVIIIHLVAKEAEDEDE